MAISRDMRQLKIGVGVLRIGLNDPLEIRSRFLRVATYQIVVANIIQKRRRGRSLRQRLLVDALRLAAFLLRIEPRGFPQVLRSSREGEQKDEKEKVEHGFEESDARIIHYSPEYETQLDSWLLV